MKEEIMPKLVWGNIFNKYINPRYYGIIRESINNFDKQLLIIFYIKYIGSR